MDGNQANLQERMLELRQHFNAGFSRLLRWDVRAEVRILLVGVAGVVHALPLTDLIAFSACRAIITLPGQRAGCLGITGHGGRSIPVMSLATLLGMDESAAPTWLAVSRDAVGIAVTSFIGQVIVGADEIRPRDAASPALFAHARDAAYPIVDVRALTRAVAAPSTSPASHQS